MSALPRLLLAAAGIAVVVGLFLVLRPDEANDEENGAPHATTTSETNDSTGADGAGGPRVIRFDVTAGEAQIERVEAEEGERVVLVVDADVSDHVHLHGYDIEKEVAPGEPARIEFRATIPGRFEVELEEREQQIAELTVQP